MTEIDNLRRITLRDLKPFFNNFNNVREQLLDVIEKKPERIREALEAVEKYLQGNIIFTRGSRSTTYTIQGRANELGEMESFLFKWESDGEQREQRVNLSFTRSNLEGVNAPCYYFVCPYTHRICRKLYTDGRVLISRYGFTHTYSRRNYSHRWREERKALEFAFFVDNEKYKGKREWYGGKLTRFGRKIRKIAGGDSFEEILARQRALTDILLASPSRRGRPPKPESEKPRGRKQPPTPPLFMK